MFRILAAALGLVFLLAGTADAKEVKAYYPDGKIKAVMSYNKKNELDGVYRNYWATGQLKEEGVYKNGKRVKVTKRFSIDGVGLGADVQP